MMTLWCMFRSPLFFGGELRDNDDWTLSLLTNDDVLAIHKYSFGNRQVFRTETEACWMAYGDDGVIYIALFNLGDVEREISVTFHELGVTCPKTVIELWTGKTVGQVDGSLECQVRAHGASLFRMESA